MINEKQARKFCRDDLSKIENYDKAFADKNKTWDLHHRLELTMDGEFALTAAQLKMHDMYYNRPYYELIFLTLEEHRRLHSKGKNNPLFGKKHSDETIKKMSEAHKGKQHTHETRRKMSEAQKGKPGHKHSEETRRKISEAAKNISVETRRKMSEAAKRRWRRKECV